MNTHAQPAIRRRLLSYSLCTIASWWLATTATAEPSTTFIETPSVRLQQRIDEFIRAEMTQQGVPGVAVAIVNKGRVTAQGYGYANLEHQVAVTDQTIFQSGSIGKMFTATAVMLLVEEGKISLSDSITKFFPDAPGSWGQITVRHLLTHTHGLPDYTKLPFDYRQDYSEEELARFAYKLPLDFQPGARFNYSSTGYVLLGIIIHKVSGQFYGDFLAERVFKPAGMATARIISEADIVPHRAAGYQLVKGELKNQNWVAPVLNTTADGSIYWSLRDMIAWADVVKQRTILMPNSWEQVLTPVRLNSGKSHPYGMGWELDQRDGKALQHHGGSWQGFRTEFARFQGDDLDIVVLANLAQADPMRFVNGIAAIIHPSLVVKTPVLIDSVGAPAISDLPESAKQIHASAILVDGHNDILSYMTDAGYDLGKSSAGLLHTDLARLKKGGVTAQFFSVFVDPAKYATNGGAARALKMIDALYRAAATHSNDLQLATSVEDIRRAKREGRLATLMGIEGGYAIENSLEVLRAFHRLGVRYMTLTHTVPTGWAGAATNGPGTGLTAFGRDVVREMNRLGMLVDVSHVSDATMSDVLDEARAPVIASHSSCRALCDLPRNIPDELLRRIGTNRGVVMLNFYSRFLDPNYSGPYAKIESELDGVWVRYGTNVMAGRAEETRLSAGLPSVPLARLVDHIDHIVRVAGIDHVGLGSDFDGMERTPVGLEDVSCYPNLTAELLRRGYSTNDVRKVLGENFLRVLAEAERVAGKAERLTRAESPPEDDSVLASIGWERSKHMVPMRDGVKLYTEVLRPKNTREPLPLLLKRTPYNANLAATNICSALTNQWKELAEDGYIFVNQDIRGKFQSEGEFVMLRPLQDGSSGVDESSDSYDTIEWLIRNVPYNNGAVGIFGTSYVGWTTLMGTRRPHLALRAACEEASPADMFLGDDFHHNGAFRLSYGYEYACMMETARTNVDVRLDHYDAYDAYLRLGSLANVAKRWLQGKTLPTWNNFVLHPNYDEFWQRQALASFLTNVTVPILHVAGWWDQEDFYGPQKAYELLEQTDSAGKNFFIAGPWNHGGWSGDGRRLGKIDFGSATGEFFRKEIRAKWFAMHLKGRSSTNFPEAITFQTGANKWESHDRWPPRDVQRRSLYFHEQGRLSFEKPARDGGSEADRFVSDPAHPVPYRTRPIETTYGDGSRWSTWLVEDQRHVHQRPDVLTYETETLGEDLVATGEVVAHLFAATSGTDADWIVKLIDVYPPHVADNPTMGGYQLMVANEVFRGRFHKGFDTPEAIPANEVVPYQFSLHSLNHRFLKGHKIMVQVQSTWFPLIDRNPQKFVPNIFWADDSDFHSATHQIMRSAIAPSHVELPVRESSSDP